MRLIQPGILPFHAAADDKAILERLAEGLARGVSNALESVMGTRADMLDARIVGDVTWADLCTAGVIFLLALVLNGLVWAYFRRNTTRARKQGDEEWRPLLLEALRRPLALLLWTYSIYLSLLPLLPTPVGEDVHPIRIGLHKAFDLGVFIALFWLFFRLTHVFEARLRVWASASDSKLDDVIAPLVGKGLRVFVPVTAILLGLPLIGLSADYNEFVSKASSILIIGAVSWVLFQAADLIERVILNRYDITVADNLRARQIYTQVHVLKRTAYFIIIIFAVASTLMLFEEVRRLGTSILASAGVLGIIIGFAAQKTIANLFAGFQIAMTQPIRLDDVVIVENEWGRIEEITLTYVVVRIWDLRRLVLPISYFIEKPFQNWTRVSADILGTIFLYLDYTIPVEEVRKELRRLVENAPEWDRKVCGLQVTNATDRTVELRALVSAADASKAWDLRCKLREQLIAYLQQKYPDSLPRVRASFTPDGEHPSADRLTEAARLPSQTQPPE